MHLSVLLAVLLVAAAVTPLGVMDTPTELETSMEQEKRAPVPQPEPVSHGGIRYETANFERSEGLDQNSGYIAAVDEASGERLWVLKVYDVSYKNDLEGDLQDVFISDLALSADGTILTVTNEEERRFEVTLADPSVREITD